MGFISGKSPFIKAVLFFVVFCLLLNGNASGDRRVYIVGAGFAGRNLAKEMKINTMYGDAVAFLDDDPAKIGLTFNGIPILGPVRNVAEYVQANPASSAIIAIPGASNSFVKELSNILKEAKFNKVYILPGISPGISQVVEVESHLVQTRVIDPRELLGRPPVTINLDESLIYLRKKRVFITGAGGSIGSELCRQLLSGEVMVLYLFGQGENSIYQIDKELKILQHNGVGENVKLVPVIGDLKDTAYVDYILGKLKVDVIFHTAAYKHVPMMEENPVAVITNNLFGTENIIRSALKHGVERFVHITTDKAVEPVSVYGASKYLCELLILDGDWVTDSVSSSKQAKDKDMKFMVVRFGNVLASRGSIVPLFQQQIERGGPVTVTHPDMQRWFMTIPEACSLVLQAGGVGESGNLYLLDMGEPIRIKDLAEQMIRFYGLEPEKDIKIVYIGLRAGERLGEHLWSEDEKPQNTPYDRILLVDRHKPTHIDIKVLVEKLKPICYYDIHNPEVFRDDELLKQILFDSLPSLKPSSSAEKCE